MSSIEDTDSPASSPSEDNPPTENIAFMITKTAVQVLSSGEVHDIVSQKGGDVQTVNIDTRKDGASEKGIPENTDSEEPVVCLDKKLSSSFLMNQWILGQRTNGFLQFLRNVMRSWKK